MAVSKRTRYEVLKRDAFTCRYCGGGAPDVELTVDHVVPVALGGDDKPDNLVAACRDCNAGKASTKPDDTTVADVSEHAERWSRALRAAGEALYAKTDDEAKILESFWSVWSRYTAWHGSHHELPENWESATLAWWYAGVPENMIVEAAGIALNARNVNSSDRFRYFCGVCKRRAAEVQAMAEKMIRDGDI